MNWMQIMMVLYELTIKQTHKKRKQTIKIQEKKGNLAFGMLTWKRNILH